MFLQKTSAELSCFSHLLLLFASLKRNRSWKSKKNRCDQLEKQAEDLKNEMCGRSASKENKRKNREDVCCFSHLASKHLYESPTASCLCSSAFFVPERTKRFTVKKKNHRKENCLLFSLRLFGGLIKLLITASVLDFTLRLVNHLMHWWWWRWHCQWFGLLKVIQILHRQTAGLWWWSRRSSQHKRLKEPYKPPQVSLLNPNKLTFSQ